MYSIKQADNRYPEVAVIQGLLTLKGFGPLAVDGYFGPKTESAVKVFQQNRMLTVDGIVGPKTWGELQTISVGRTPILTAPISVLSNLDAAFVTLKLYGPNGKDVPPVNCTFTVDTGAFECMIPQSVADALGLKNLGTSEVAGVGGVVNDENSTVGVVFGGVDIGQVECTVTPSGRFALWGLRFAIQREYSLSLDLKTKTLNYYR